LHFRSEMPLEHVHLPKSTIF